MVYHRLGMFTRLPYFILSFALLLGTSACDDFFTKDVAIGSQASSTGDDDDDNSDPSDTPRDDDADGLSNAVEDVFDMDSRTADIDHDGFSDGLEFVGDNGDPLHGGFSPSPFNRSRILSAGEASDAVPDRDKDGLGDTFETQHSLNPDSPDMDGDGYQDGLELVARSDPFRSGSRPEREAPPASDGVSRTGSGPRDGDVDGLSDDVEGLNGTHAGSFDTDGDGYSDGIEYLMGSDGTDFTSVPNFSVPLPPDDNES